MAGVAESAAIEAGALSGGIPARTQFAAVAAMRRRMLINGLRTRKGKFELGSRIVATGFLALIWLAAGTGCGFLTYEVVKDNNLGFLPFLFWPVFFLWQTVPLMIASSQENVELNFLLRFPVSFRFYFLLYLFFGLFDLSTLAGGTLCLSIWVGLTIGRPQLCGWAALALAAYFAFNFLLIRMVFAWISRWLAQRKTREVLGICFLVFFVGLQLLNPAYHPHAQHRNSSYLSAFMRNLKLIRTVQTAFPPGLAAASIQLAGEERPLNALGLIGGVAAYAGAAALLLGIRLRSEFRGESLGEAPAPGGVRRAIRAEEQATDGTQGALHAASLPARGLFAGPIGGILAKEMRSLRRSGVMMFSLFTPLVFLFLIGGTIKAEHSSFLQYAFPVGVAYAFLPLTRQVCNSLGGEGAGVQLYFLCPTPFRTVMLAKNLFQLGLFGIELTLACSVLFYRFGAPALEQGLATLCWLLFALPANLAVGNILSLSMAYRMTTTRVSREQGSVGNGLLSLACQLALIAAGAAVYLPLAIFGHSGFIAPIFLLMACATVALWLRVLANVDRMAASHRETLIAALVRPA